MYASGGGGGGGHFVGLDPDGARSLASGLAGRGSLATTLATRISGMLCEAGPEGAGCETPEVLRRMDSWLETSAEDVRWRIEVVAGGAAGGMRFAYLRFPSAAAARADGRRYARLLTEAMDRYWEAYGDSGEDEAAAEYLRLVQGMAAYSNDPMWSASVVNALGTDGIIDALWVAKGDAPEDFDRMRETVGPLFQSLASAMEHGEADPKIRRELMNWPTWDLALVLALAPAETGFLTAAAKTMLVDSQTDDDMANDPGSREYELIFSALADNAEASYRVLTGKDRHGFPNTAHILMPWDAFTSPEAARELGRMLEAGLVEFPAADGGRREWDNATTATEEVMQLVARMRHVMDEVHPDLNASLAGLLRPHLDAIALISARDNGSTAPGPLEASLPRGRRALDVDIDTLEDYLGATMQQDSGVAAVQLLLAAYSQQPSVQANRLPLLSQDIGNIHEFDDFATDSVRIAALAGVIGAGLDKAGHDEEARTRLLVGALNFASGKATGALPVGKHPAVWLGQKGADYLAGEAIDEFEEWLQSREPMEGEVGVGSFLESYSDTTVASLREHIAADPELSQLSGAEQEELIESVRHWVRESVRGPMMEQYAELVGETAGE